jgi:hypothetical protein
VIALVLAGLFLIVLIVRPVHPLTSPDSSGSTLNGPPFAYSYTCCTESLVNTVYHPGDTIAVRWIRSAGTPTRVRAASITLSTGLSGPYRTVILLKTDSVGAHPQLGHTRVSAVPIRVMDTAVASPVSILRIPANAGAGFYNLTSTAGTKNLKVGGAGIIRVAPPAK